MKPKMKKNPNYRGYGGGDDEGSGIGFDKKHKNRKERRVFTSENIKNYYKGYVEPALKEEEEEELEHERREREAFREAWDADTE